MKRRVSIFGRLLWARCKFNPTLHEIFGASLIVIALLAMPIRPVGAAGALMRAHRNTRSVLIQKLIEKLLVALGLYSPVILDQLIEERRVMAPLMNRRCFKLKECSNGEKGVLILKFNDTFTTLHRLVDMERLLEDYTLCLELSYYGCCNPQILQFLRYGEHHVVVGAVQKLERGYLERLEGNLVLGDYSSSTWVDDKRFRPLALPKEYDCILIGMWEDIKRHYLLFRAIAELNDPTYRACLVGFTLHQDRRRIEELIDYFGVRNNIIIFERAKQPLVNELLNKSKVNLLLSFKEGGNKGIIEGFFADVPGIVLDEHIGIDLGWINSHTGRLVKRHHLSDALQQFRTDYTKYHPRDWALQHISCAASTAKLEATLRDVARREGRPWTRSLAIKVNIPECSYYDPDARLRPLDLTPYLKTARFDRVQVA